ncbi:MAG: hypothetical protein KKH08_01380, partial [Candidatus Omnitrophica bacterium]|nr:hypothetical protein [Candidatus Omnitrophota bacterium]
MKIFIMYAYAGVGHKKAADAVENALRDFKGAEVKNFDILDYTNPFFKFTYPRFYLFMINRIPLLWGFLYYFLDAGAVDAFLGPFRRFLHRVNSGRLIKFIINEKPDVIISTHFIPGEIAAGLKRKGLFKGRLITIVTDFMPHSFWMAKDSDYFIGAIDKTKKELMRRGISEEKIKALGIPCDPVFGVSKGRREMINKLGLKDGFFNLLIMGGGFGTGPVREIVRSVCGAGSSARDKIQVIVICGKNKKLLDDLNAAKKDLKAMIAPFGYMNNIDE